MTKYFTKSAVIVTPNPYDPSHSLDCDGGITGREVIEVDYETWTGLLDAKGNEIHRTDKIPLGFNILREKP